MEVATRKYDARSFELPHVSESGWSAGRSTPRPEVPEAHCLKRVRPMPRYRPRHSIIYELAAKRWLDVTVALLLLILLTPGFVLIAAAIKTTSRGPVLFRQKRYGLRNRLFEILKFRSMAMAASDPSGVTQTQKRDSRVTPIGHLLRRSSLDELPQLWNVLKGDMSLVGPRPHVPRMLAGGVLYEELVPYYFERHDMRAGITGLAQVNGLRGSTIDPNVAKARIDQDLEYIRHWSFGLDMRILWQTFLREFLTGNGD